MEKCSFTEFGALRTSVIKARSRTVENMFELHVTFSSKKYLDLCGAWSGTVGW